jgi:hypothetical protein
MINAEKHVSADLYDNLEMKKIGMPQTDELYFEL